MLECKFWEPDAKEKGQNHMQVRFCLYSSYVLLIDMLWLQHVLSKGLRLMEDRLLANDERKQDNIAASESLA